MIWKHLKKIHFKLKKKTFSKFLRTRFAPYSQTDYKTTERVLSKKNLEALG
jgi:hypothetical protein